MGKRANPMAVKASLTYDIAEAAKALGVTPVTIRNWIKDGLPVMSSRKPFLILGEAVREYLQGKRKANKRPLQPDELFCPSCRDGQKPVGLVVTITQLGSGTSLLKGDCEACGCTNTRMIAMRDRSTFAATFQIATEHHSEP